MASNAAIVEELMRECGKTSDAVRNRISQKVGEVVTEILQQNEGRFKGLFKSETITVTATERYYRLPSDFHSPSDTFHEVDSDGDFVSRVTLSTKSEIFGRKEEGITAGEKMAYVEFLESHGTTGRGWYLVLADAPTESKSYVFDYYREATANDADIIRKSVAIKHGTRGQMPDLFPGWQAEQAIYLSMLNGIMERPDKYTSGLIIKPGKRTRNLNRKMHDIGQGH